MRKELLRALNSARNMSIAHKYNGSRGLGRRLAHIMWDSRMANGWTDERMDGTSIDGRTDGWD